MSFFGYQIIIPEMSCKLSCDDRYCKYCSPRLPNDPWPSEFAGQACKNCGQKIEGEPKQKEYSTSEKCGILFDIGFSYFDAIITKICDIISEKFFDLFPKLK